MTPQPGGIPLSRSQRWRRALGYCRGWIALIPLGLVPLFAIGSAFATHQHRMLEARGVWTEALVVDRRDYFRFDRDAEAQTKPKRSSHHLTVRFIAGTERVEIELPVSWAFSRTASIGDILPLRYDAQSPTNAEVEPGTVRDTARAAPWITLLLFALGLLLLGWSYILAGRPPPDTAP